MASITQIEAFIRSHKKTLADATKDKRRDVKRIRDAKKAWARAKQELGAAGRSLDTNERTIRLFTEQLKTAKRQLKEAKKQ